MRSLLNNGTENNRPATAFYHETENRAEDREAVTERRTRSEGKEKESEKKKDNTPVSEPEVQPEKASNSSTKEGDDNQSKVEGDRESNNEKTCLTAGSAEDPSTGEQTDNQPANEKQLNVAAASNVAARSLEEPSDVSDMMLFSLDSPGGSCVVSLSLMTLGLLSVYLSIPKQMVVVDSNLVDNDVVKRYVWWWV